MQGKEIQREKNRIRKIFSHENPKKGSVKYKSYLKQQAANCKIQKKLQLFTLIAQLL